MLLTVFSSILLFQAALAAPSEDRSRVINGTDTTIEDWPFMISIRSASTGSHSCGGSILSNYWILTAAHCVNNFTSAFLQTIQVGRTEISKPVDESVYAIDVTITHPGYDPAQSYVNDIALLKLKTPLGFTDKIQPVKLPPACFEVDESDLGVTLIGWGLNSDGVVPSILQMVDYYVVPNEECDRIHSSTIYPSQICAAEPGGGKGQCNGDSGGPLLHNGMQVGIVSWSIKPCTIAPYPGILTKVSHYVDFIYSNTNLNPPSGSELGPCS